MSSEPRRRVHHIRPLLNAPLGPRPELQRPPLAGARRARGEVATAVSRAIAGLLPAGTGKPPTKVKTEMSTDLAIVTLRDWLTTAEDELAVERSSLATQLRTALRHSMRAEAVAAVEDITSRPVVAYLTDHQPDPDLAIIAFHLGTARGLRGQPISGAGDWFGRVPEAFFKAPPTAPDRITDRGEHFTPSEGLTLSVEEPTSTLLVRIGGELDLATIGQVLAALDRLDAGRADLLVFDLQELDFLDVAGLRTLLRTNEICKDLGVQVVVIKPRGFASRVFTMTRVNRDLDLVEASAA